MPTVRHLVAALVAVSLLGTATSAVARQSAPPVEVPPGVGIGLAEAPTARSHDPRAHVYIIDHVSPGTTFSRRIRVSNGTDRRATIALYAAAAEIRDGSFRIGEGRARNDLSSWTSVTPDAVTLDPGGITEAVMTITVPPDASPGEHYAAALAELPPPQDASGPVRVGSRVGIRIYLSVGAGGEPASDFVIGSLTAARAEDGRPLVTARVVNTGGRALDLRGELTLSDGPGGLSAGPFPAQVGTTLAPGGDGDVSVPLDPAIPAGPWLAQLALTSGTLERSAQATITFPDAPGGTAAPVEATPVERQRRLLGSVAVGLILLTLAGLVLLVLWRRRRDEDEDHDRAPASLTRRRDRALID